MLTTQQVSPVVFNNGVFLHESKAATQTVQPPAPSDAEPQHSQTLHSPIAYEDESTAVAEVPRVVAAQPAIRTPVPVSESKDAQLSRMVDDLVGPEDESSDLAPMQPEHAHAGSVSTDSHQARGLGLHGGDRRPSRQGSTDGGAASPWQAQLPRTPGGTPLQRLHSVSNLWDVPQGAQGDAAVSGQYASPRGSVQHELHAHTRVNSAASVQSRSSPHQLTSLSSFEPTPPYGQSALNSRLAGGRGSVGGLYSAGMQSPLLFGAGGGLWSTGPRKSVTNMTPPNGQGGG